MVDGVPPNPSLLETLRRCEEQAVETAKRGRVAVPAGPFLALLDPSTDLIWVNYAVPVGPVDDGEEIDGALQQLRAVFAEHGRVPRFEFDEELWPGLGPRLERAGFELQVRHPLMLCLPDDLRPFHAAGVQVRLLTEKDGDQDLAALQAVQQEGFGMDSSPEDAEGLARLRADLAVGTLRCALATLAGSPAGAGCTTPLEDVAELAGVATIPAARRRGVAATLSSVLAEDHFGRGGTVVWLSAGDAIAQAVYEKIGFRLVGTRLNYIER